MDYITQATYDTLITQQYPISLHYSRISKRIDIVDDINQIWLDFLFLYPLKMSENQTFSNFFKG